MKNKTKLSHLIANMNTEKLELFFSLIALAVVLAGILALALKLDQSFPI